MPAPIDPTIKAAILASIQAGGKRNEIAREYGVGAGTVTKIAQDNDLAFDRSVTKNATRAKQADNAELRATTSRRLLVKANEFLDQMDAEHTVFNFGGKDNTFNSKVLPKPPVSDLRNLMTAAAVAIDKHLVIEKHDNSGESHAAVDAWLTEMTGL